MPIYEYACEHCGDEFEKLVPMRTRDEDIECPSCDQPTCHRRVSTFSAGGASSGSTPSTRSCGPSGFS